MSHFSRKLFLLSKLTFIVILSIYGSLSNKLCAQELQPKTFVNSVGQTMIWVEPGINDELRFRSKWQRDSTLFFETFLSGIFPRLEIKQGYYLAATECTQEQWMLLMGGHGSEFRSDDNQPVTNLTWFEAQEFCARLTERERKLGTLPDGYEYRLPTEVEWEYACRAGNKEHFWRDVQSIAFYREAPQNRRRNFQPGPRIVAELRANAFGFHDMHGNVFEWCENWYDQNLGLRVSRGGGWHSYYLLCQAGARFGTDPHLRSSDQGFRPALLPIKQSKTAQQLLQEAMGKETQKAQNLAAKDEQENLQQEAQRQAPPSPQRQAPPSPKPKQAWTSSLAQEFVWISPGIIEEVKQEIPDDELEARSLVVSEGFHIARTECTLGQWAQLMGGSQEFSEEDKQLPVSNISWREAREFAQRLSIQERLQGKLAPGWRYALPSIDQWEWACRAKSVGSFAGKIQAMAWARENSSNQAQAVAKLQPNTFGLFDMHGNVAEFCEEWEYGNRTRRVVKGGNFQSDFIKTSSEALDYLPPEGKSPRVGFRLVIVPDENAR